LGVVTISRGCFERGCSNKKTPPDHSNGLFLTPPCSVFKKPFHGVDFFVSVCLLLFCLLHVAVCSTSLVCAVRNDGADADTYNSDADAATYGGDEL